MAETRDADGSFIANLAEYYGDSVRQKTMQPSATCNPVTGGAGRKSETHPIADRRELKNTQNGINIWDF